VDLDSLLSGDNAEFIDAQYLSWCNDPASVEKEWAELFAQWTEPGEPSYRRAESTPPSIFSGDSSAGAPAVTADQVQAAALLQARVAQLINAYRVRGHVEAKIDPLGLRNVDHHPELTLKYYGLTESDLDVEVSGHGVYGVGSVTTLRELIRRLRKAYCGGFGVEFKNINDPHKKSWLEERIETLQDYHVLSRADQEHMLRLLSDSENFEQFLHRRYPGTKRFSLEGAETLIPLLAVLIDTAAMHGTQRVMLGMAHRGRLNVLANILNKPVRYIVDEFDDEAHSSFEISGDVKYHLGYSNDYTTVHGDKVRVTLAFNPSHLEAVNSVVQGRSRARQDRLGEDGASAIMPLVIHGDAAFAGQGVVAEGLQMSQLPGYHVGGTVHVVVNNQIGFTTSPKDARSTPYCTDVARMLAVPIFHVNGEDVEAVSAVSKLAAEWRQTFKQDVIIDLYCFRKWGHNEGDEPSFTQPLLYEAIRKHPSAKMVYAKKMVGEHGDLTMDNVNEIVADSYARLEEHMKDELNYQSTYTSVGNTQQRKRWSRYHGGTSTEPVDTTYDGDELRRILLKANSIPEEVNVHRKIRRIMGQRIKMVNDEAPVDWAVAEQAAYATIVMGGDRIRISGQDVGRGTFSHRHAVLTDITNGERYIPLANLSEGQGVFDIYNSLLSEYAVLGFEHGYSLDWPDGLIIWEAQFGDFANGAQIIIDNFIMATEQKWARTSGLVMLLPHGYAGQGPEHSSARLERYLQLCAEENVVVANCTKPANFYHLLRRQVLQRCRKPLVVMSPKSLLRHPRCVSTMSDLIHGKFHPIYGDTVKDPSAVKRIVFCSGKIYYELLEEREKRNEESVALIRLERLYPFPRKEVNGQLALYSNAKEVVWCQEEPRNMGAWPMVDEWFGDVLGGRPPRYIGRKTAASPASGSPSMHRKEQRQICNDIFDLSNY
jgi:2-oxoglutarate dehydrogenase E1 component